MNYRLHKWYCNIHIRSALQANKSCDRIVHTGRLLFRTHRQTAVSLLCEQSSLHIVTLSAMLQLIQSEVYIPSDQRTRNTDASQGVEWTESLRLGHEQPQVL
jgi:hypothetical protein